MAENASILMKYKVTLLQRILSKRYVKNKATYLNNLQYHDYMK